MQAEDQGPDDKLDRTIFVGNLHAVMKPKAIKQLFSRSAKQFCLHVWYRQAFLTSSSCRYWKTCGRK